MEKAKRIRTNLTLNPFCRDLLERIACDRNLPMSIVVDLAILEYVNKIRDEQRKGEENLRNFYHGQ